MTAIPCDISSLPVTPVASHDGDHLQRMAVEHPSCSAILSVSTAPARNSSVTSGPVTCFLFDLSAHVMKTWPFRLFTGGRGTPRPPRSSGQTGTISAPGCSASHFRNHDDIESFFPCHRTGSPNRHRDTSTFMFNMIQRRYLDVNGKLVLSIGGHHA